MGDADADMKEGFVAESVHEEDDEDAPPMRTTRRATRLSQVRTPHCLAQNLC